MGLKKAVGVKVYLEWTRLASSLEPDHEILTKTSKRPSPLTVTKESRKRAFCFTDDSSSSSDFPLSRFVPSTQEAKTAAAVKTSSTHFIECPTRTMVSEKMDGTSNTSSTIPLSNEDSNSSDGPLLKLNNNKDDNFHSADETSNSSDAPLCKFKRVDNQVIDENSNSSDVPLSKLKAKNVMVNEDSNSSDVPLSILKKLTNDTSEKISDATGNQGIKKRKRALSSDDEESVQPKVRRTKKDLKESKTSVPIKRKDAEKSDEDSSASSDDEIFPTKSRQVMAKSKPIDSELESGSDTSAESNSENEQLDGILSSEDEKDTKQKASRAKNKESTKSSDKSSKKELQVEQKERKPQIKPKAKPAAITTVKQVESSSSSSDDDSTDESSKSSTSDGKPAAKVNKRQRKMRKESEDEATDVGPIKENAKEANELSSSSSESSNESDKGDKEGGSERNEESTCQAPDVKTPKKGEKEASGITSDSSDLSDLDEKENAKVGNTTGDKENRSSKQGSDAKKNKAGGSSRITRLQRYLKEAGIRVASYKTLWEGCKSDKAKAAKLLGLLEEHGLKGKPTLTECRKLRKKLEREREVAELSTANIIQSTGRPRRNAQSLYATSAQKNEKDAISTPRKSPEFKKAFSRLRAIVDSEDSD